MGNSEITEEQAKIAMAAAISSSIVDKTKRDLVLNMSATADINNPPQDLIDLFATSIPSDSYDIFVRNIDNIIKIIQSHSKELDNTSVGFMFALYYDGYIQRVDKNQYQIQMFYVTFLNILYVIEPNTTFRFDRGTNPIPAPHIFTDVEKQFQKAHSVDPDTPAEDNTDHPSTDLHPDVPDVPTHHDPPPDIHPDHPNDIDSKTEPVELPTSTNSYTMWIITALIIIVILIFIVFKFMRKSKVQA